jgi:deoxyhypusine synthase
MTPSDRPESGHGPHGHRALHDGRKDGLAPVRPLEIHRCRSLSALVEEMKSTSFGGRRVGEAADVLQAMTEDEDCLVVGTFSGAMTVGMMGHLLCDMLLAGHLDAVVSTGALMAHGFVQAAGLTHYKWDPRMNDEELYAQGYNRVYDTLEMESNLDDVEKIVGAALSRADAGETLCSRRVHELLGDVLLEGNQTRGILPTARRLGIPVYVPAFTDSELGLDFEVTNRRRELAGQPRLAYDPFLDLRHYADLCRTRKRLGIFTIGGGVPRNWAQQMFAELNGHGKGDGPQLMTGIRICPDAEPLGHLSGSTFSEARSWRKIPAYDDRLFAEVPLDFTLVFPLLAISMLQHGDTDDVPLPRSAGG